MMKEGTFWGNNTKMKKDLGVSAAMSIVVGCVIGAGVFFKPHAIYGATGGAPGMGMLAWIFGGIASLLGALTFAEVAVMIPKTGGMVAYLGDVFGEKLGFLAGWMQTIIFFPAFLAGYGVTVSEELGANLVPANSIILIGFLACLYSLIGQFNLLTDLAVSSCWISSTLTFACVIKLRKTQPDAERMYKVPCYPWIPLLSIASGLYVIVSQLFLSGSRATIMSLFSIGITLLGLPVYLIVKKKQK